MSQRVSFIIPVLNEQGHIGDLLRDLRKRFPDSELIVVDGGSQDKTVVTAMPLCDQLLIGQRGRSSQMNLGGHLATADYVLFLHADSNPSVDVTQLEHYLDERPAWGFCKVRLSGRRRLFRVIEWFMNQRSSLTRVATGDQMLFLRRSLFDQTEGFEDLPLMEDVAYCKRLRRCGGRPLIIQEPVLTSSRRWEEGGVARTVLRMWLLRLAYFLGASPDYLWRNYYGK